LKLELLPQSYTEIFFGEEKINQNKQGAKQIDNYDIRAIVSYSQAITSSMKSSVYENKSLCL